MSRPAEAVLIDAVTGAVTACFPTVGSSGSREPMLGGRLLRLRLLLRDKEAADGPSLAFYDYSSALQHAPAAPEPVVAFSLPWPFGLPIYFGDVIVCLLTAGDEPHDLTAHKFLAMFEGCEDRFAVLRLGVQGFDNGDYQRMFTDAGGPSLSDDGDDDADLDQAKDDADEPDDQREAAEYEDDDEEEDDGPGDEEEDYGDEDENEEEDEEDHDDEDDNVLHDPRGDDEAGGDAP
jgi:hypothetical protein